MNRRRFLTISAAAAIAGPARADTMVWQAPALGGTVRVDLRGPRDMAATVATEIAAVIAEVEAAASLFDPASALSRLNAAGRLDDPPTALVDMLDRAALLHDATGGLFDPTVQPLWRALAEGRDPGPAQALVGWHRLRIGPSVLLDHGQALTLNGIAQGYAADRVRAILARAGYDHALVDMGEFAALGGPFTLGIEDPAQGRMATRRLSGGAIATSSPRAMLIGTAGHILGPRGEPPLWSTVSVEADEAALADGLSTACCLMGAAAIRTAAARLPGTTRITAIGFTGDLVTLLPA